MDGIGKALLILGAFFILLISTLSLSVVFLFMYAPLYASVISLVLSFIVLMFMLVFIYNVFNEGL